MSGDEDVWTMEHPRREEMERLQAELETHPGRVAYDQFIEFERTFNTWSANAQKLQTLLHLGETDPTIQTELMRNVGDQSGREAFMRELDAVTHAYGASLGTLVEATRTWMKKYPDSELWDKYREGVARVRAVEGADFIVELRDYLIHYKNIPYWTRGSFSDGAMKSEILIDTKALNRYSWKSEPKRFLAAHPDHVHLSPLLPEYHRVMSEVHAKVLEDAQAHHKADIAGANELVRQLNLALTDGITDGKDWEQRMQHIAENHAAFQEGRPQTDFADWKAQRDSSGEVADV